jgi:hypothetical protein
MVLYAHQRNPNQERRERKRKETMTGCANSAAKAVHEKRKE